ncbi:MAG: primosomal protein N' [Eubacteriales bacterium]|nr:primosomal protein N' [Eubacteriales bacterium]MDD3882211.1 primosomal protein N' [Eubacteriales bacterium]MDD4512560.1 primosomal protein N' [Eubacteriales bacterium]
MFAEVMVDIAHENVAHVFTYSVPQKMSLSAGTRVLVPFGRRSIEGYVINLCDTTDCPAEKLKSVIKPMEDYPLILPKLMELAIHMQTENHSTLVEALRLLIPAQLRSGQVSEKIEKRVRLVVPQEKLEAAIEQNKRSKKRQFVLRLLSDYEEKSIQELTLLVKQPQDAVKELAEQGLVEVKEQVVFRSPMSGIPVHPSQDPELTQEQSDALDEIIPQLRNGKGSFLLHGVTGSGKSEVYIRLVRETLKAGKGAIVLVPEIALTPQMVSWFHSRFGERAAVLHSRLTAAQRYDEWRRIRFGMAQVVIGARSAVFAPLKDLGLIVVDEEHEQSYISDKFPRYDAREIAAFRCQNEGATLLLASATPSILSFAKAQKGDYDLLEMPHRVHNRPMAHVELVDMRQELKDGNRSIFSRLLLDKLKTCIGSGHQCILFLNRRGYAQSVTCRNCGEAIKCSSCDIAMTYHQDDGMLHCHYCGNAIPLPSECPSCHSAHIKQFGIGTQRVEEEIRKLFPDTGILRMDLDTTEKRGSHEEILDAFRARRAQVLIGTQMIAKGLDFPAVTLVGVIMADLTLMLPDFRAPERTFQLLTQVSGRAGRADEAGEVVVQTYKPEHYAIAAASRQDYREFFQEEFARRRRGLFPPFTMICRLLLESPSETACSHKMEEMLKLTEDYLELHPEQRRRVLILRGEAAPVKMIRGKFRYHILLKLLVHKSSQPVIDFLQNCAAESGETTIYCEVDPATLM